MLSVSITPSRAIVNGECISENQSLRDLYKSRINDYPKFYKMDLLSQLAFVASELLLQAEGAERFVPRDDRAIVLVGNSASIAADLQYQVSISNADNYFPSPSAFIYTLPNVAAAEIAIRNNYHGETIYIAAERSDVDALIALRRSNSVLGGWINANSLTDYEANLKIYEKGH